MNVLILDNYDSFTYNLVQLVRENSDADIGVFRNDEISLKEAERYDKIILSPGPGIPKEAGILCELINHCKYSKPILGVCLGMQAIGEVFGANLINMRNPLHGISTKIRHKTSGLFNNIPIEFEAARYHSWILEKNGFPKELVITAIDDAEAIMAIEHQELPIYGVQFHPESILTGHGKTIVTNFLNL